MEPQSGKLALVADSPVRSLRVLVDGRKLGDGGIGVYTANLISGLLQQGAQVGVVAMRSRLRSQAWRDDIEVIEDDTPRYSLSELVGLARKLPFGRYDVFHSPHYMLPFFVPIPSVVTIHDLIHVTHPERRYYPWLARPLLLSALARASRVVAVSRSTYDGLASLGVAARPFMRKVRVVPNALSPLYLQDLPAKPSPLSGRYLFAVCSQAKPHKGVEDLIAAFNRANATLRAAGRGSLTLVLAGYGTQVMIERGDLLNGLSAGDSLRLVGSLSDDELNSYLAAASAVVIPSLAEGFGLPLIEAHARGVPVIMRPVPALREIAAAPDVVARDFSIEALAEAIQQAACRSIDARTRDDLRRSVEPYRCSEIGRAMLQVYGEVAPSPGTP